MVSGSNEGLSQKQVTLRKKMEQIRGDAIQMAGAANQIAHILDEILSEGGAANIQKQMSFLVSALARMQKDVGVTEYLQQIGTAVRKPTPLK